MKQVFGLMWWGRSLKMCSSNQHWKSLNPTLGDCHGHTAQYFWVEQNKKCQASIRSCCAVFVPVHHENRCSNRMHEQDVESHGFHKCDIRQIINSQPHTQQSKYSYKLKYKSKNNKTLTWIRMSSIKAACKAKKKKKAFWRQPKTN